MNQFFTTWIDLVHHPIDSQPFVNGWPSGSHTLWNPTKKISTVFQLAHLEKASEDEAEGLGFG